MIVGVGIRGLVTSLTHPSHRHNFGASVITNMDKEISSVVSSRVYGNMSMGAFIVAKDDKVAGGEFVSVYIRVVWERGQESLSNKTPILNYMYVLW